MVKTYRHAGDAGDLAYFLAIIKHLGRGILYIEAANYTRVRMTPDKYAPLVPLLKAQDYIEDVREWTGQNVDVCGNDFRALMFKMLRSGRGKDTSLLQWMMMTHGVPPSAIEQPWIKAEPKKVARVIFNRSGADRNPQYIYWNERFPWHSVWAKYHHEAIFLGLPAEYELFRRICGEVPYYPTSDLLQAAQVIAGADIFVGNQSLLFAIATAMRMTTVLEVWKAGPNVLDFRPNSHHGWDQNVTLPDL